MAFLQIISDNIVPLLVFVAIGYLLDLRYHLDVISLNKLTFFVVLPSFIFYSIYVAEIDMTLLNVFLMAFVQMFLIALVFGNAPYVIDGETPYLAQASACATILLVQMNMTLNTLGLYQAGKGKLTPRDAISVIFHMPVIYTLVAVFTIKFSGFDMTQVFLWPVFENCANALVSIVMLALGIQIHRSTIVFRDIDAWVGCTIRLVIAPLLAYLLLLVSDLAGLHLSPVLKQTILIMASVPGAVNSVLYAVEFHNFEDFATELVMMSTFLSCITMTGVIYLARVLFPIVI